jgi:secondary thiamine-phosphate synthase enzyme
MKVHQRTITVRARRRGLNAITREVAEVLQGAGIKAGLCHVFIRHTSASLLIQENADPSAAADIESCFDRLAPEDDPHYTHTAEGPDDMPSHVKAALTSTSELIPVVEGRLGLGTWQGIYLFEHRNRPGPRELVITVWGD